MNVRTMVVKDYNDVNRIMNQIHNMHILGITDIFKDDFYFSN